MDGAGDFGDNQDVLQPLMILLSCLSFAHATPCFNASYCAVGDDTPTYPSCPRGQTCGADLGLRFSEDCQVSWCRGDVVITRKYSREGNRVTISAEPGDEAPAGEEFVLSDHDRRLESVTHPHQVYSTSACKGE
jgi:hypothetical protein